MAYIPEMNSSISHGTMRTQDLLRAFAAELESLGAHPGTVSEARQYADMLDEDDVSETVESEAACVLDELFDELNNHAPAGSYFGAHPGDGSDYGYWEIEE